MSTRTQLLAKLHITLKECGAESHKEAIYASYGVASARDLSDRQLLELIGRLNQGQCKIYKPQVSPKEVVRKKRSEILSLLTKSPQSANPRYRGLGVPNDWTILNPFIERHAGKLLFNLSVTELEQLRGQLLAMRSKNWYYGKREAENVEHTATKLDEQSESLAPISTKSSPKVVYTIPITEPRGLLS